VGLTEGGYDAFCLDQAIYFLGTTIEGKVNAVERGKKESDHAYQNRCNQLLYRLLGMKQEVKYADPAASFGD
jgi:hypothetical protein